MGLEKIKSRKKVQSNLLLLLASIIWGFAFVAQRVGMESIGPLTYSGVRFLLGALSLLPLVYYTRKDVGAMGWKKEVYSGIFAGMVLFVAVVLQQWGLVYTTASNAAFITGLYIVLVPVLGIFLRQKVNSLTWPSAILALIGLYLLSIKDGFRIEKGDLLEIIGAFFWAVHILVISNYSRKVNVIKLSFFQFITCSILSMLTALFFETITIEGIHNAMWAIVFGGFFSVGIAYTLQVVGQKNSDPSHAALILSLEAVFGAVGGYFILSEYLGIKQIIGCSLMLIATSLAQLPYKDISTDKNSKK